MKATEVMAEMATLEAQMDYISTKNPDIKSATEAEINSYMKAWFLHVNLRIILVALEEGGATDD